MIRNGTTICAPATSGAGAIAVIRISGPESFAVCGKFFSPAERKVKLRDQKGYTIIYGDIRQGDEIIDDVLVSIFRAPRSYTGEDSVEISCHASSFIQHRILELLINNGAVAAKPGEFTLRAFLNGRLDLSQAEAVADLVASTSRAAHHLAINQIRGGFSAEIAKLRQELLHFASLIELELDFGEEDVEFAGRKELREIVSRVRGMAESLASSFKIGNVVRNGIPVAIVGKPNSGKSTLLNAMLMEERAIVSEIPGTTRDVIEDTINIDGIEYRFIDTAGLRDTPDLVESLGIRKTHEKIDQASVILMIDEVTDNATAINKRADEIRQRIKHSGKRLFILINKIDIGVPGNLNQLKRKIQICKGESLMFISAKEKTGLDELRTRLGEVVEKERLSSDSVIITNIRHYEALLRVSESLGRVGDGLNNSLPGDLIAIDLRQAIHYLGEITGEITTEEILGNIFRNFCIGK